MQSSTAYFYILLYYIIIIIIIIIVVVVVVVVVVVNVNVPVQAYTTYVERRALTIFCKNMPIKHSFIHSFVQAANLAMLFVFLGKG